MTGLGVRTGGATLLQGERLVLRAVRLLALDARCGGLKAQFEDACGCSGAEAYCGIAAFVAQLRLIGRRGVVLSPPAYPGVTEDELLILEVFACAQQDDYPGLDSRVTRLVGSPAPMTVGAAACMAAQILALNGLVLRAPGRVAEAGVVDLRQRSSGALPQGGSGETRA